MKKYLKKITSLAVAATILSSTVPLYALNPIRLEVNGNYHSLQVAPIVEDGTTLVGIREIFEILGATVDWNQETEAIKAKLNDIQISLMIGSKIAMKNEMSVELPTAPKKVSGRTMIPLRFVSEAFGGEVEWDETSRVICIDTNTEKLIDEQETNLGAYPTLSINEEGTKITYDQAVEKALANSLALKSIEESIKVSEELQETARDAVTTQRPSAEDYTNEAAIFVAEAVHINSLLGLIQADYGVEAAKYKKEIQEGVIKYQVKSSFDSIQNLKKDAELLNKSLETSKIQLEITKKKADLGLESDYNKTKEEQDYDKQQKKLEALKKSLDIEYIKLNRLMGVNEKETPALDYTAEYAPKDMSETELDSYIARALVKDPSIILRGEAVRQAEYSLQLYTLGSAGDSYEIRKSKLNQAKLEETQAKNNLRDKIRTTYNQIKQLEEQYNIDALALNQAKKQYDVLKTQYNLGMVIEVNLKQAELGILSAQAAQEKTAVQHAQLIYLLNNPYLLQE